MNTFSDVPPGFRFHPTDEELVDYYLRKKISSRRIDLDVIKDIDLYKIEPWDLQELCKIGSEEQNEWYFFSHKDKKYPTGTRTNRATKSGFWKATGRDKAIYSKHSLVGMRKTLVFYKGRAPNGQKSDWIIHEYRLETNENGTPQEEGWVVCRAFKKRITAVRRMGEHESPCWYEDQVSFLPDFDSPRHIAPQPYASSYHHHHQHYSCKQELELQYKLNMAMAAPHDPFLQLPHLESPKLAGESPNSVAVPYATAAMDQESPPRHGSNQKEDTNPLYSNNNNNEVDDQLTDWRVLDKFVASQLSQEDSSKENNLNQFYPNTASFQVAEAELGSDYASVSTPTCPIDLWK